MLNFVWFRDLLQGATEAQICEFPCRRAQFLICQVYEDLSCQYWFVCFQRTFVLKLTVKSFRMISHWLKLNLHRWSQPIPYTFLGHLVYNENWWSQYQQFIARFFVSFLGTPLILSFKGLDFICQIPSDLNLHIVRRASLCEDRPWCFCRSTFLHQISSL